MKKASDHIWRVAVVAVVTALVALLGPIVIGFLPGGFINFYRTIVYHCIAIAVTVAAFIYLNRLLYKDGEWRTQPRILFAELMFSYMLLDIVFYIGTFVMMSEMGLGVLAIGASMPYIPLSILVMGTIVRNRPIKIIALIVTSALFAFLISLVSVYVWIFTA